MPCESCSQVMPIPGIKESGKFDSEKSQECYVVPEKSGWSTLTSVPNTIHLVPNHEKVNCDQK